MQSAEMLHQTLNSMRDTQMEIPIPVEVLAATDPVLCNSELPFRAVFYPVGFAVEITTNWREVLDAAEESWGHWRQMFSEPPVRLRIGVTKGNSAECPTMPVTRAWLNLLTMIADRENYAICDMGRALAFGWFTQATVADRAYFRYHLLEPMALDILTPQYLTPLHAACVSLAEKTVLLCGDSGAGKSSLSFACARRGWTFLADDSVSLIRSRDDRFVIGNPYSMRFREASIELFPELGKQRVTPRATGEMAIEVAAASMPKIATALTSSIDYIVFLNRQRPGPPTLAAYSKEVAASWFEQVLCYGEKEVRESQSRSLRQLLAVPVYELCYTDLDWAVNRLDILLREGD
jgi:hypothetical protein